MSSKNLIKEFLISDAVITGINTLRSHIMTGRKSAHKCFFEKSDFFWEKGLLLVFLGGAERHNALVDNS